MKILGFEVRHAWEQLDIPKYWPDPEKYPIAFFGAGLRYDFYFRCRHCGRKKTRIEMPHDDFEQDDWPLAVEKLWEKAQ